MEGRRGRGGGRKGGREGWRGGSYLSTLSLEHGFSASFLFPFFKVYFIFKFLIVQMCVCTHARTQVCKSSMCSLSVSILPSRGTKTFSLWGQPHSFTYRLNPGQSTSLCIWIFSQQGAGTKREKGEGCFSFSLGQKAICRQGAVEHYLIFKDRKVWSG